MARVPGQLADRCPRASGRLLVLLVSVVGPAGHAVGAAPGGEPRCCWPRSWLTRTVTTEFGPLRCRRSRQGAAADALVAGGAAGRATPVGVTAGAGRGDFAGGPAAHDSLVHRRSWWLARELSPGRGVVGLVVLCAAASW